MGGGVDGAAGDGASGCRDRSRIFDPQHINPPLALVRCRPRRSGAAARADAVHAGGDVRQLRRQFLLRRHATRAPVARAARLPRPAHVLADSRPEQHARQDHARLCLRGGDRSAERHGGAGAGRVEPRRLLHVLVHERPDEGQAAGALGGGPVPRRAGQAVLLSADEYRDASDRAAVRLPAPAMAHDRARRVRRARRRRAVRAGVLGAVATRDGSVVRGLAGKRAVGRHDAVAQGRRPRAACRDDVRGELCRRADAVWIRCDDGASRHRRACERLQP